MIVLNDKDVERVFLEAGFKLKDGLEPKHWGAAMGLAVLGADSERESHRALIKRIVAHAERDPDNERKGAPDHCHSKPYHWDADGSPCQECRDWDELRAVARGGV